MISRQRLYEQDKRWKKLMRLFVSYSPLHREDIFPTPWMYRYRRHRVPCSCCTCGNPRRHKLAQDKIHAKRVRRLLTLAGSLLLLISACTKHVQLPPQMGTIKPDVSIVMTEPQTSATVRLRVTTPTFTTGMVFTPGNVTPTCEVIQVMRAAGLQRLGYVSQNTALWDCAAKLDFYIDPTYVFSAAWVNWMRDNIYNHPERIKAAGYWSGIDEPSPENGCSAVPPSQCFTNMAQLFNYAHQQIPAIKSMLTLPATCLFNPSAWWGTKCGPYYTLVRATGNDYFPWQWGWQSNPAIVGSLVANLAQRNGGKDIVFYADGGSNGAFPNGGVVPENVIVLEGSAIRSNAPNKVAYVLFDTRDAAVGSPQWMEIVRAIDQLTPAPSDINYDNIVDYRDCQIANSAYNNALKIRIMAQISTCDPPPIYRVYLPLVRKT